MNVGQLEEICRNISDKTMDVFIHKNNTDFANSSAETALIKKITFSGEGIPKREQPKIDCLVITDEI